MKSNDDALQPLIFFVTMVVSFGVRNTGSATVVHATVGHGSYATRMETTTTSQTTYLTIIAYVNRTRGSMRLVNGGGVQRFERRFDDPWEGEKQQTNFEETLQ